MKKYSFPLDNVLNFRDQVLENLKSEHAQILMRIADQEKRIADLKEKHRSVNDWLNKEVGSHPMPVSEVREYRIYMNVLVDKVRAEEHVLQGIRLEEEKKRNEVVAAKKDKASIQKLKEKSQIAYQFEYQKDEERMIEEFVSSSRLIHAEK